MSVNYDQGRASEPTIAGQSSASGALPASGLRLARWIVLVGLMGAGKSAVGRRLAQRLNVPFVDADAEIELAAGESINDIFAREGEAAFRTGERKVIARLLAATPAGVLATGGGAFMDEGTRGRIRAHGLSVWLRADLDTLFQRTSRRHNRPLLAVADPRARLAQLMAERHPIYQQAEVAVDSRPGPVDHTVEAVTEALARLAGPDGIVGAPPVGEIEAGR